jgi:hypothetical protein
MMSDGMTDFIVTLRKIARGREDGGRPLAGDAARELAREVLNKHHVSFAWSAPDPLEMR